MTDDNPDNTSPDTISDDDVPVSIGEIADAVFEKIRGLIPGQGAGEESAPPATTPSASGPTDPPAAAASPAPSPVGSDVESAVERVLARKDTDSRLASVESKVAAPPEPKPKRTGIGALLFGPNR